SMTGVTLNCAVGAVQRAIAQADEVVFIGYRVGYSPESDFAISQQLPFDFSRVAFSQHIFAAQEIALGSRHEAMPEAAHFGKTHIGPAVVDYRLAHTPEELNFALIGVIAVNLGHAQRNPVTFLRPAQAIVVGVFELEVAEGIDAPGRTEIRNH